MDALPATHSPPTRQPPGGSAHNVVGGLDWPSDMPQRRDAGSSSSLEDTRAASSENGGASTFTVPSTLSAPKSVKRRRVSDSRRLRAEISCDRCKTRKTRCIRSGPHEACAACQQLRLVCETDLQRKQKSFGSRTAGNDARLESHCRALEALVSQVFPGINVQNTDAIVSLAGRSDVSDHRHRHDEHRATEDTAGEGLDRGKGRNHQEMSHLDDIMQLRIPEGSLIPAPNGVFHYVGPASSYHFANTVRYLVTKSTATSSLLHRHKTRRRQERAADFTSKDRTTALEARVSGHPITTATSELTTQQSPAAPSPVSYLSPANERSVIAPTSRQQLRDTLPKRKLADQLVKTFFAKVHLNMSIFHRGSFQIRYESLWDKASSSSSSSFSTTAVSVPEPGWICALFMVFVLGAQATDRTELPSSTELQSKYLSIVIRDGLQRLVLTATLTNVQALLLLSLYQHNVGERNTSWMLLGHATRMGMALGLQRDGENGNFDAIERNVRLMLWWQLQLFEQSMSFELGRPCSTEGIEVTASLPDEAVTDGGDSPPDYLANAISLGSLSLRVKRFVAAYSGDFDKPNSLLHVMPMAEQLDRQLLDWQSALPPHLHRGSHFATSKHRRLVLMLHACFHHIRSILGRPYLLCSVHSALEARHSVPNSSLTEGDRYSDSPMQTMARLALDSASTSLSTILDLAQHGLIEGEIWHDFYYGHHASMILSLPFLVESRQPSDIHRGLVSTFLNLCQRTSLAPTYRILINVSIQFAKIVGIGPEDDPSRPPSPHLTTQELDGTSTMLEPQPVQTERDRIGHWSNPNLIAQDQPLTLEQLLGVSGTATPMATSSLANPPDWSFSDLYNFGFAGPLMRDYVPAGLVGDPSGLAAGISGEASNGSGPEVGNLVSFDGSTDTGGGHLDGTQSGASGVPRYGVMSWDQDFFGIGGIGDPTFSQLGSMGFQDEW